MKSFTIILATMVLGQVVGRGEISYDPNDWPQQTLRLSAEGTLKDVFDAGIRPFRIPSFESWVLGFKHSRLRIRPPEGPLLPEVAVEHAEVRVKLGGLWKILIFSPPMTLDQSQEQMSRWLPLIDKDEPDLSRFLKIVDESFLTFDDRDVGQAPDGFSGGWSGENKEMYTVCFQKSYNPRKPLLICVRVFWIHARPRNERRRFFDVPIPPPEGYEDVSMEAPENWGPDSEVDIAKWRGEDIGDGTGPVFKFGTEPAGFAGERQTRAKSKSKDGNSTGVKTAVAAQGEPGEGKAPGWLFVIGGLIALALLAIALNALFFWRSKRSSRS